MEKGISRIGLNRTVLALSVARQMSVITMGFGLGIAVGPLVAGLLAVYDFDLPFAFVGAALLASAWIISRKVPETVGQNPRPPVDPAAIK